MPDASPGRAQLIDTALRLFSERGHDAVTVRDIAAEAHVSLGLIAHHFGSKDGLRRAVDASVLELFDSMEHLGTDGAAAESFAAALLERLPAGSPVPAYLRRLLLSGDPAGHALFERWHALSATLLADMQQEGVARASADPDTRAAFLLVNDLAMILMHEHIAGATGSDPLTPDGARRWTTDAVDAYTHGVLTPSPLTREHL